MKKIIFNIFLVAIFFVNSIGLTALAKNSDDQKTNNEYKYEVTTADKQWSKFKSRDEMVNACKISENDLEKMTTEELVYAVLDYPLLINLYAYDSYEAGLEALSEESDAFKELLKRTDASEKLLNVMEEKDKARVSEDEDTLEHLTLSILLSEKTIWNSLSDKEKAKEMMSISATSTTVKTPNGTSVPVLIRGEELSSSQKTSINNQYKTAYPLATYLSTSTTNYNCHSYAWYSASTSNKYWMNNPSSYMTDGSYTRVYVVIDAAAGTRMYYDNGAHSAIVYQYGGPLNNANLLKVTSKWGQGPLMRHTANYSPYASSNVTLWKR